MINIILVLVAIFEAFIIIGLSTGYPLSQIRTLSEIIQALSIAAAALLGGFGGLRYAEDSLERRKLLNKIKKLREKYPISSYDKEFYLVNRVSDTRTIYLFEIKRRILRHIVNPTTLHDLYLSAFVGQMVTLPDKKFLKIDKENPIDTTTAID